MNFMKNLTFGENPYVNLKTLKEYKQDYNINEHNYIIGLKSIFHEEEKIIFDFLIMKDGTLIGYFGGGKSLMKYKPNEKSESKYCKIHTVDSSEFFTNKDLKQNVNNCATTYGEEAHLISHKFDSCIFNLNQKQMKTSKIFKRYVNNDSRMYIFQNKTIQYIFGKFDETNQESNDYQVTYFYNYLKRELIISKTNGKIHETKCIQSESYLFFNELHKYKSEIQKIDEDFENHLKQINFYLQASNYN